MELAGEGESFEVIANGRAVADVVPHRPGTGRRRLVPVAELAAVFAVDRAPDPAAWQADVAAAEAVFAPDVVVDPFEADAR